MLPESNWNSPFIPIEAHRNESQYDKFTTLSELWNSPFPSQKKSLEDDNWDELFAFQNQSLKGTLSQTASSNVFFNQIQNACWQFGKNLAEKDWPTSTIDHPHDAFLALATLRIGNLKHSDCFLLERKTKDSCTFYWLSSQTEFTELCMLYHEIFRGYFYQLSHQIRVEILGSILPNDLEKVKVWKINLLWID